MVASLRHKRSAARLISLPFPTSSTNLVYDEHQSGVAQRLSDGSTGSNQAPRDGYSNLFASGFLHTSMDQYAHDGPSPTLSSFPSPPGKMMRGPFHPSPEKASPARSTVQSIASHGSRSSAERQPSPIVASLSPDHLSVQGGTPPHRVEGKMSTGSSPQYLSPAKTPVRRRRSSIMHTTPSSASPRKIKAGGTDSGVERALDNVMRSLKVMAMGTPRPYRASNTFREESRWSSSSSECASDAGDSVETGESFWRSRKSTESSRSRITMKSTKSTAKSIKSVKSKKGRKSEESDRRTIGRRSEDTERMDVDGYRDYVVDVPPVPAVPTTPGRKMRMMEGLVRRLGLTPKKKSTPAVAGGASAHVAHIFAPPPIPDLPQAAERTVPRKGSLSTLRSAFTRKTSTGTLRSVKSNRSLAHPFLNNNASTLDCSDFPPPPLPPRWKDGEHGDGCLPMTPNRGPRRSPKTSIGQPRLMPSTSPSQFLKDMPRKAPSTPTTPKQDGDDMDVDPNALPDIPPLPGVVLARQSPKLAQAAYTLDPDANEVISFSTPPPLTAKAAREADASIERGMTKSKRLLNLLPRQNRFNGLPISANESSGTNNAAGKLDRPRPPLGGKSINSLSSNLIAGHNGGKKAFGPSGVNKNGPPASQNHYTPRDPLGLVSRFGSARQGNPVYKEELPFRAGAGDGWDTPALPPQGHGTTADSSTGYFDDSVGGYSNGTFGESPPLKLKNRSIVPDFTASPEKSFQSLRTDMSAHHFNLASSTACRDQIGDDGSVTQYVVDMDHNRSTFFDPADAGKTSLARKDSSISMRSYSSAMSSNEEGVPREEWELEAFLKKIEREDREREERVLAR